MALGVLLAYLKQLAARLARGGNNGILSADLYYMADYLLARHGVIVFINDLLAVFKRALADNERDVFALSQKLFKAVHSVLDFAVGGVFAYNKRADFHILKQLYGDLALINMLRLVVNPGLAAPADYEYHRDSVDLIIQKRGYGIDYVALAAVLHINNRNLAGGEVIARRKSGAVALVSRYYMVIAVDSVGVHKVIAERL